MKFPTYKEIGEKVAKEALDTVEYNGKTLREWIEIISATELDTNCISRQAAIDAIQKLNIPEDMCVFEIMSHIELAVETLPPAQPDGIPLEWIDKHLEWLDNCDNDFAQLAKVSIRAMVEIWKKDRT